jgi:transposase
MIAPDAHLKVYVATRPIDFREGHDGLAAAVQEMIGEDPFSGAVFVFRSKRADRLKVLVWDRTGLVLIHKRLEGGKFVWPPTSATRSLIGRALPGSSVTAGSNSTPTRSKTPSGLWL